MLLTSITLSTAGQWKRLWTHKLWANTEKYNQKYVVGALYHRQTRHSLIH